LFRKTETKKKKGIYISKDLKGTIKRVRTRPTLSVFHWFFPAYSTFPVLENSRISCVDLLLVQLISRATGAHILRNKINYIFKARYSLQKGREVFGLSSILLHCLMPTFREYCSSLHQGEKQPELSCSSEGFPIYIRYSVGGEEEQDIGKRKKEGRVVKTVIVVIIFLRLTSRSIFDNREWASIFYLCCRLCLDYRDVSVSL